MSPSREVAARGIRWNAVGQTGRQLLSAATLLVLARLLEPGDFGLLGMATVVTGFLALFRDLGTGAAIVHRRDVSAELLSSLFWLNLGIGLVALLVTLLAAPLMARFYGEPRVTGILLALSVSFPMSALGVVPQALLERDLAFAGLAKAELGALLVASGVGIAAALLGAGVWSLVYQSLVGAGLTSTLLWLRCRWRPRRQFHWAEFREVRRYGLHLTGYNVFNYFSRNADTLLIGRYLGATPLGVYTLAYRLLQLPLGAVTAVVNRVMFPALSKMHGEEARITRAYLGGLHLIALITFPLMLGLLVLATPFTLVVLGPQWVDAIPLMRVFALVGLVQCLGGTVGPIYQATGRTDLLLYWGVGTGMLAISAFAAGLRYGVLGVAVAYAILTLFLAYPNFAIPLRLIGLAAGDVPRAVWKPLAAGGGMTAALLVAARLVPGWLPDPPRLAVLVGIGALTYLALSWAIDRQRLRQMLRLAVGAG